MILGFVHSFGDNVAQNDGLSTVVASETSVSKTFFFKIGRPGLHLLNKTSKSDVNATVLISIFKQCFIPLYFFVISFLPFSETRLFSL